MLRDLCCKREEHACCNPKSKEKEVKTKNYEELKNWMSNNELQLLILRDKCYIYSRRVAKISSTKIGLTTCKDKSAKAILIQLK